MNTSAHEPSRDDQLEAILVAWLEAVETGQAPDPQEWLARHPQFADELREFFAAQDEVRRLAGPVRDELTAQGGLNAPTLPLTSGDSTPINEDLHSAIRSPQSAVSSRVRYFGDYELLEEVARGGMGVVYRARQSGLSRIVALKMILAGRLAGEEDVKRFRAEAEAAASLDHPHIVPVFEVGEHEGQHYFSMGYVEGESLADRLRDGPLPPRDAARLTHHIAEAVAYAHGKGVIHRDLKPANILLSRPESPPREGPRTNDQGPIAKITDFGLAKRVETDRGLTATGQILGTPSFMPPEQASGRVDRVKETADVYSLGAILYAMLTGRPPFQADNPIDTLVQVMEQEPVAPRQLNPKVPRDLETICLKCLEKEPPRRYTTAAALAEDLDRFLRDEPIRARRLGGPERAWRWLRKQGRSVAVAAAATAVTIVISLLALAIWYSYSQWRLGELSFDTDQPPLVAEIFDEEENLAAPVSTLPTSAPISLPAGDFKAHISGEGRLSQTYHVAVTRGEETPLAVNLEDQTLFPTMEIEWTYDLVPLDGRTELAMLDNEGVSLRNEGLAIGRFSMAPQVVWRTTLKDSTDGVIQSAPGIRWPWTSKDGSNNDYDGYDKFDLRPQFVGSRRDHLPNVWSDAHSKSVKLDLDGDGGDDLVLAAHHQAWLLAMNGKNGQPLWIAARSRDVHGKGDPQFPKNDGNVESAVIGVPQVAGDLDGDGAADLIATFVDRRPTGAYPSDGLVAADRWVEAVSGKTGATIWRYDLPEAAFQTTAGSEPPYAFRLFTNASGWSSGGGGFASTGREVIRETGSTTFERLGEYVYVPDAARIITSSSGNERAAGPKQDVVILAGTQIIVLSAATGEPVSPAHETGLQPLRPLVLTDLTGDGSSEAVLVAAAPPASPNTPPTVSRMAAFTLNPIAKLWLHDQTPPYRNPPFPRHPRSRWPLAADLDGDGADELLVPADPNPPAPWSAGWRAPTGWLEVLDGRTGKSRWLTELRTLDRQVDHFAVGPDVDGDGQKEIFVATLLYREPELFIDCLSGADGQKLWWTRRSLENKRGHTEQYWVTSVAWWGGGGDGWPQLLAAVQPDDRRAGVDAGIHVFSAGDGKALSIGKRMSDIHLADFDGDGHDELVSYEPWIGRDRGGRLEVHCGGTNEVWRRLGGADWMAVDDLDGDKVAELVYSERGENFAAVSGATGETLWRSPLPDTFANPRFVSLVDFDGDRVPEILAAPKSNIGRGLPFSPFHLFSGRDGRRLWSADMQVQSGQQALMQAVAADLDGDRAPEIVVIGHLDWNWVHQSGGYSSSDGNIWLAVLSGRTGAVRWKQALSGVAADGTLTMALTQFSRPVQFGEVRIAFGDLDGDGVRDLLLPAEVPGQPGQVEVRALNGSDGSKLWSRPVKSGRGRLDELVTTAVAIGDLEGKGPSEALVLELFEDPQNRSYGAGRALVTALSGSGRELWQWEAPRYFLSGRQLEEAALRKRPAMHLLRVAGQSEPLLCVNFWGNGSDGVLPDEGPLDDSTASAALIAVFDAAGRLLSRIPMDGATAFAAWPLDADGDGSDELAILSRKDGLRVVRPGARNEVLWRRAAGDDSYDEIVAVLPASDARPMTIVVRESERMTGFAAAAGRPLWRTVPPRPRQGRGSVTVESLPLAPGITAYRYGDVTLAARSESLSGDAPPHAPPRLMAAKELRRDARWTRPLPWLGAVGDLNTPEDIRRTALSVACMVMYCVVLIFLPGWYVLSLIRRRAWGLKALFLAPVLVGLALVALSAPTPFRAGPAALLQKLSMGVFMLPVALLAFSAVRWTTRRNWRRLGVWFVASLLLSAVSAALMIGADRLTAQDSMPYSWEGWPLVLLIGVYFTGWLLIPAAFAEWAVLRIKQNRRGGKVM